MIRTIKEATVKRFHYESHEQLRVHLADFMAAFYFARRRRRSVALRLTNTPLKSGRQTQISSSSIRSARCWD